MSFSSGTFSLVAGNPVVTGTTISSTVQNNTLNDIATGLSTCILKDGTQTATGTIPFTSVTLTGTVLGNAAMLSPITNSLGADVLLNNTANYFDGPSVAQGAAGTWLASGTVTVWDTSAAAFYDAKLWDGSTVIASGEVYTTTATSTPLTISLAGYLTTPAGNLRISVKDKTNTTGKIVYNSSGNSKDSTITAIRIG